MPRRSYSKPFDEDDVRSHIVMWGSMQPEIVSGAAYCLQKRCAIVVNAASEIIGVDDNCRGRAI